MTALNKQALIAKIKKQTESFDTVVLKEDEANLLLDELEVAEKRIAELEARKVRLPDAMMPARHNSGELFMSPDNIDYGGYLNRDDVVRNLRAAGIGVKGE